MPGPHPSQSKKTVKSAGLVGIATLISRFLGLLREIVTAAFLGTSFYSDAFTLAFAIPNLFRRLFAEGILVQSFLPVYSRIKSKNGNKTALTFASRILSFYFVILLIFCTLLIIKSPWLIKFTLGFGLTEKPLDQTVFLFQIMIFYILFISLGAILQGILNAHSIFGISALTPVLLNVSIIGFAYLVSLFSDSPALGLAIGVLVGGIVQFASQIPATRKLGLMVSLKWDVKDRRISSASKLIIPTLLGAGVYQINILMGSVLATPLGEGAVSSLKFSNRLLEFIIGVLVVSVTTVILPKIVSDSSDSNKEKSATYIKSAIKFVSFLTIPTVAGVFAIGEELVELIFSYGQFDSDSVFLTSMALKYHIVGLIFVAWSKIILTFYQSIGQLNRTVQVGIIAILINIILAVTFSKVLDHCGIALALTLSQLVQTCLLVFFLRDHSFSLRKGLVVNRSIIVSFISSIVMLSILIPSNDFLSNAGYESGMRTLVIIPEGMLIYLTASFFFQSTELKTIGKLFRSKA